MSGDDNDRRGDGDSPETAAEEWFRRNQGLITAGELSAGIAHEARNMLTGVLGMVQLLRRRQVDEAKRAEWMERIETETRRCVLKLNEFLRMPRTGDYSMSEIDLNEVVDLSVGLTKHMLEMQRVQLIVSKGVELPPIRGSVEMLRQVAVNLIINAMQVLPDGGVVRLTSGKDGDDVLLSVGDDGPGVPEELRERVFEPMFTTKPVGEGTGLGLSFCRQAAATHGGTLTLQEGPEGGALFTLRVPRAVGFQAAPETDEAR